MILLWKGQFDFRLALLLVLAAGGCASQKLKIPNDAVKVAEGAGPLGLKAPDNGTAMITDKNAEKVIYNTPVKYSDLLLFDPKAKRILLNGRVVKEDASLDAKQVHRLYFLKG